MERTKLTVDLPPDLKMEFKVFCVSNQLSMTKIVEELIRDYLNVNQRKEKGAS